MKFSKELLKVPFLKHTNRVVFVSIFAGIGVSLVLLTRAATYYITLEPEVGTISGNAYIVKNDATASNSQYVSFHTCTASPTTTCPPNGTLPDAATGGRPFSAASPWNTPTSNATKWYDTTALHVHPGGADTFLHWWVNTGSAIVWYGKESDPIWTFNLPDYIAPTYNRNRAPQTFQVHAPANMHNGGDSDKILTVVNGTTYYEVWNSLVTPATMTVTNDGLHGWATGDIVTGPGAGTLSNNDGTRAANFSWIGGLITGHDFNVGVIDHALAIALTGPMLNGTAQTYIPPATAWDSQGFGPIKMGSKIGVPIGVTKPAGLSSLGTMVFDALQKYGAYVGDYVGGAWPAFYTDENTVPATQMDPLYAFWNYNGSSDMEKIGPLLRVADYQP